MKGFAKQLIDNDLYIVAEEFLLPEKEFVSNTVDGYYDIKQLANLYKVVVYFFQVQRKKVVVYLE